MILQPQMLFFEMPRSPGVSQLWAPLIVGTVFWEVPWVSPFRRGSLACFGF